MSATIRPLASGDDAELKRLRAALWPDCADADHDADIARYHQAQDKDSFVAVAARPDGVLAGFAELSVRPYANGCATSPVAFLEGWIVDDAQRRKGVGKALVDACAAWATARGLAEMGSDTWLDNELGRRAHLAAGFRETDRVICFVKDLA